MTTELDRFYLQTRPDGASDYAVWIRHSYQIGEETRYDLEGPLTPDQAEERGFPLATIMDGVAAAAVLSESVARTALSQASVLQEQKDDIIASLELQLQQAQTQVATLSEQNALLRAAILGTGGQATG